MPLSSASSRLYQFLHTGSGWPRVASTVTLMLPCGTDNKDSGMARCCIEDFPAWKDLLYRPETLGRGHSKLDYAVVSMHPEHMISPMIGWELELVPCLNRGWPCHSNDTIPSPLAQIPRRDGTVHKSTQMVQSSLRRVLQPTRNNFHKTLNSP